MKTIILTLLPIQLFAQAFFNLGTTAKAVNMETGYQFKNIHMQLVTGMYGHYQSSTRPFVFYTGAAYQVKQTITAGFALSKHSYTDNKIIVKKLQPLYSLSIGHNIGDNKNVHVYSKAAYTNGFYFFSVGANFYINKSKTMF